MGGLLKEITAKTSSDLFEDRMLLYLLLITASITFAICLGYNIPFGFNVNLFFPASISVVMVYLIRIVTKLPKLLFMGSGRTVTQEEANSEFEIQSYINTAKQHEKSERYAEAAEQYERALTLKPDEVFVRQSLAMIYLKKLRDYEKALRQFKLLADTAPDGSRLRGDAIETCKKIISHLKQQKANKQEKEKRPESRPSSD